LGELLDLGIWDRLDSGDSNTEAWWHLLLVSLVVVSVRSSSWLSESFWILAEWFVVWANSLSLGKLFCLWISDRLHGLNSDTMAWWHLLLVSLVVMSVWSSSWLSESFWILAEWFVVWAVSVDVLLDLSQFANGIVMVMLGTSTSNSKEGQSGQ